MDHYYSDKEALMKEVKANNVKMFAKQKDVSLKEKVSASYPSGKSGKEPKK